MKEGKYQKCEHWSIFSKVWLIQLDKAQSCPHEVAVVRGTGERIAWARRGTQSERKHTQPTSHAGRAVSATRTNADKGFQKLRATHRWF